VSHKLVLVVAGNLKVW